MQLSRFLHPSTTARYSTFRTVVAHAPNIRSLRNYAAAEYSGQQIIVSGLRCNHLVGDLLERLAVPPQARPVGAVLARGDVVPRHAGDAAPGGALIPQPEPSEVRPRLCPESISAPIDVPEWVHEKFHSSKGGGYGDR